MVARLIRLRRGNYALAEEPALVEASAGGGAEAQSANRVRPPYQARHAKPVDPEPPSPPFSRSGRPSAGAGPPNSWART